MVPFYSARKVLASLAASLVFAGSAAAAVTVGGFPYDESSRAGSQDLKLNGAGVRYKLIFPVYSAGLYLNEKKKTPAEIYATPGAKRMRLVMQRTVNAEEFGQAFLAGIQQNSDKAERARLVEPLMKFGQLFATVPELKKGDTIAIDFIPGQGTIIQIPTAGRNPGSGQEASSQRYAHRLFEAHAHSRIAFAACFLQPWPVENDHLPAAVADQP
jgi:hypothetical protein